MTKWIIFARPFPGAREAGPGGVVATDPAHDEQRRLPGHAHADVRHHPILHGTDGAHVSRDEEHDRSDQRGVRSAEQLRTTTAK